MIGILALAAIVRLWGIDYGLPCTYCRPDEDRLIATALRLSLSDPNPHYFIWPSLPFYFTRGLLEGYSTISHLVSGMEGDSLEVLYGMDTSSLYILMRLLFCVLGVTTVFFLYLLGKKMFSVDTGLLASFFLSLSPLHVRDSHFAMLDIPFTFLTVAFFLLLWRVYLHKTWKSYLLAGILGGIASSVKYFGIVLIIPLFVAGMINSSVLSGNLFSRVFNIKYIVSVIVFCLVLVITSPYIVLDFPSFILDIKDNILLSQFKLGHTLLPELRTCRGWLYHITFSFRYGMGLLPEIICILGVLWSMYKSFRGERKQLLLLSFIIPFYLLLSPQKKPFIRYVIVLLPFLYLAGSRFLLDNLVKVPRRVGNFLLIGVILMVVWEPLYKIIRHDILLSREDSRITASRWMGNNIPANAVLIFSDPLIFGRPPAYVMYPNRITLSGEESAEDTSRLMSHLRSKNVYLIVTNHFLLYSTPKNDALAPLIHNSELVYSVEAFKNELKCNPVFDPFDAYYVPLSSYFGVRRPGPNIQIYRLYPIAVY